MRTRNPIRAVPLAQSRIRVFAIYQILFGLEDMYKYCCENDELPNPRPTQSKKNQVKKCHVGHFFFPQQVVFGGLGLILYREQATRNPTQPDSP